MAGLDVFEVADVFVEFVRREYRDDVALIAYYGSYARGSATEVSDLDLFFVPSDDRGRAAARTALVAGITFDFWAIDWSWLERSARLEERGAPLLAEAQVLYSRSVDDVARLQSLQRALAVLPAAGDPRRYAELAAAHLSSVYPLVHAQRQARARARLDDCRRRAVEIVSVVCTSIALLNRTSLRRGSARLIEEAASLPLAPTGLAADLRLALAADDVESACLACVRAVDATAELINERLDRLAPSRPPLATAAVGFYEELSGLLAKIGTACQVGDHDTALFTALVVEQEMARLLGPRDRPDLVPLARLGLLPVLLAEVERLRVELRRRLTDAGVQLLEFASADELGEHLRAATRS